MVFWAFATWLIPVLVAAGWWRHVIHRVPLRYEATLWSIVFPLGMYAVAGIYLGRADHLPVVERDRPRRAVGGVRRLGCSPCVAMLATWPGTALATRRRPGRALSPAGPLVTGRPAAVQSVE